MTQHIYSEKLPRLRVNAKVHKVPCETRPIVNSKCTALEPASKILNEGLIPILQQYNTIITKTSQVVDALEGRVLQPDEDLFTYDVRSLYPSLICKAEQGSDSVYNVLEPIILEFYTARGKKNYGLCLVRILRLIIDCSIVACLGEVHEQLWGLTTGQSAASTIANLYLAARFDRHVLVVAVTMMRYIDDGVGI
eukprot:5182435-Lingulodinium_polyedra.AAC.1